MARLTSSSSLLLLTCSLTSVRASSTIYQLPDSNTPRTIRVPEFAFYLIFAILTFGQLSLIGSSGLLREGIGISGRLNEREPDALRRGRRITGYLMALSTSSFIAKYTIGLTAMVGAAADESPSIPVTFLAPYILTEELAEEFLLAALFALLASRVMALDRWHVGGADNTLRRSRGGFNLYFVAALLASMVSCTIARCFVIGLSNHPPGLAQFVLSQMHVSIYFILAVYFTALAPAMWKKKASLAFQPIGPADVRRVVSVPAAMLRRMVVYVCPMLCIATVYNIITDIIQSVGADSPGIFGLLDLVVEGLIYFLLILAMLFTSKSV